MPEFIVTVEFHVEAVRADMAGVDIENLLIQSAAHQMRPAPEIVSIQKKRSSDVE